MAIGCLRLSDVSVICSVVNPRRTSQKFSQNVRFPIPAQDADEPPCKIWRRRRYYFGSEFPMICNHCGVMVAWSRKTLKIFENVLIFWKKTTPYGKIVKILFQTFLSWHRLTYVQISWSLSDEKLMKSCVAYMTRTHQEMRDSEREPFYDDIARTYFKILKELYRLWDSNPRP